MECDNFWVYLGAEEPPGKFVFLPLFTFCEVRAIAKILSFLLFLFFMSYFIILRFKYEEKFKEMIATSIFSFFDDLEICNKNATPPSEFALSNNSRILNPNEDEFDKIQIELSHEDLEKTSFPSFEKNEIELLNKQIENSLKKTEVIVQPYKEPVYILDFEECCCSCFCECWYQNIYKNKIKAKYQEIMKIMRKKFQRNLKPFCFYILMIGTFVFNPWRYFISIFFNACNNSLSSNKGVSALFSFLDLICGSFAMVLYFFVISFNSTQAEFLKIYLFDKSYRARLIYFHITKAMIFGVIHFILKLLYKIAFSFGFPFDNFNDPYSIAWLIFKNCFFLISIKFYQTNFWVSIERDCQILRAHAHYFAIQNNLIKLTPRANNIYDLIKKLEGKSECAKKNFDEFLSIDFDSPSLNNNEKIMNEAQKFEAKLEKCLQKSIISLRQELNIIDNQRYKNILRNQGYINYLPKLLIFLMTIMALLILIFLSISLYSIIKLSEKIDNYSLYLNHISEMGCLAICMFEYLILPFLMYYSLKKTTYFNIKRKKNY